MRSKSKSEQLWGTIQPIIYFIVWLLGVRFLSEWVNLNTPTGVTIALLSLAVLFIGVLAKATNWSIGGEKGIKADTLGKYLEFKSGGNPPWEYRIYPENFEQALQKLKESEKESKKINEIVAETERLKAGLEKKDNN